MGNKSSRAGTTKPQAAEGQETPQPPEAQRNSRYIVNRAFAYQDVFYTTENAGDIEGNVPAAIIKAKVEDGSLSDNQAEG